MARVSHCSTSVPWPVVSRRRVGRPRVACRRTLGRSRPPPLRPPRRAATRLSADVAAAARPPLPAAAPLSLLCGCAPRAPRHRPPRTLPLRAKPRGCRCKNIWPFGHSSIKYTHSSILFGRFVYSLYLCISIKDKRQRRGATSQRRCTASAGRAACRNLTPPVFITKHPRTIYHKYSQF